MLIIQYLGKRLDDLYDCRIGFQSLTAVSRKDWIFRESTRRLQDPVKHYTESLQPQLTYMWTYTGQSAFCMEWSCFWTFFRARVIATLASGIFTSPSLVPKSCGSRSPTPNGQGDITSLCLNARNTYRSPSVSEIYRLFCCNLSLYLAMRGCRN